MPKLALYTTLALCGILGLTGCNKKATLVSPSVSTPQISNSTLNPVEALSPQARLATSYLNADGKRLDATGAYYLDEQGNIVGKVALASTTTLTPQQQLAQHSTVYFDYDSSQLSTDNQATLNRHAGYLTSKNTAKIVVEGHTDQRGTREYNLALGDRRAKQVQDYLEFTGVKPGQISTISYGKEKPVDTNTSEEAYQKNRRAELSYPSSAP